MSPASTTSPLHTGALPRHIAVFILVGVAVTFAGNHVGARIAFDDGAGLLLTVLCRSGVAFFAMVGIVLATGRKMALPTGAMRWQLLVGLLIAIQSLGLYTGVANIPVALALLVHSTFPILLVLLTWLLGGPRPTLRMAVLMGVILCGLVLAFDLPAKLIGADLNESWLIGIAGSFTSAAGLTGAVWISDHKLSHVGGAVRSMYTLGIVFVSMIFSGAAAIVPGGMALPASGEGWLGLLTLVILYGVAFCILFISVPRLDMPRNAPIMNLEPVATLIFAWIVLGQAIGAAQLLGGAVVIAGITALALNRGK